MDGRPLPSRSAYCRGPLCLRRACLLLIIVGGGRGRSNPKALVRLIMSCIGLAWSSSPFQRALSYQLLYTMILGCMYTPPCPITLRLDAPPPPLNPLLGGGGGWGDRCCEPWGWRRRQSQIHGIAQFLYQGSEMLSFPPTCIREEEVGSQGSCLSIFLQTTYRSWEGTLLSLSHCL